MIVVARKLAVEKVVLAGLLTPRDDRSLFDEDMDEMAQLVRTAGGQVMATVVQRREAPVASTYLGGGKIGEISGLLKQHQCQTLVVDAELSHSQVRNIEEVVQCKVVDRSQLILDIFAQHATTNESRLQVELAQLRTLYPRLTHAWSHFSQQVGGIGTKGPGEKQLEVDRRLVQKRIAELQRKLKDVGKSRETQRKSRQAMHNVTVVGYTNVGKSSLLNVLAGAKVLAQNKLFATLDTATRRAFIPELGTILITDTVGFIRKLPHHLVASFRSTLDVVADADLLIVLMDAASPWTSHQLQTVDEVLKELGACGLPRMTVFNKVDLVKDPFQRKTLEITYPDAAFVSSTTREGLNELKQRLGERLKSLDKERVEREVVEAKQRSMAREGRGYSPNEVDEEGNG